MTVRKKKRKIFFCIAAIVCMFCIGNCLHRIPASIHLAAGNFDHIYFDFPFTGSAETTSKEVVLGNQNSIISDEVHMTWNEPLSVYSETTGNYEICLKLFGLLKVKDIELEVVEPKYLLPCGIPTGIYLESDGVLVIGTSELTDQNGAVSEPALNIVKTGDYIVSVNDHKITDKEQLMQAVGELKGQDMVLMIRREGNLMPIKIHPVQTAPDEYKLGIWIRDDTQGIGTLTYIDKENHFGALGHGISDCDTNLLLEVSKGGLYDAKISSIIKGMQGTPGSLSGTICYGEDTCLGTINKNTSNGIFGTIDPHLKEICKEEWLPVGYKQEIKKEDAWIRCTVDGFTKDYKVKILEVNTSSTDNKGILLEVTDQELLEKTGGIVQGMSGSPIIQNGKMIGAVTHVLVNDPAKGYGIFAETMLDAGGQ